MTSFSDLGLSQKVLKAVEAAGYTEPTPIQAQAIPHALEGKDVLGIAQTGTGKTASFVLPMITRLERGRARARMPRTLILEPTRELAAQVEENFGKYGVNHKLTVALLIGGVSFEEQNRKLQRGVDVLIATPGRLLDHFERGKLLLTGVEVLVIDEADRMLDMGFIPDIERIVKLIPFTRQTLFFSATMPPEITRLADQFLHAPVRVEVSRAASTATTVTQRLVGVPKKDYEKRAVLRELIRNQTDLKNGIIFCNRKRDVSELFRSLDRHGFSVGALHGDMDQRSRMAMLQGFKDNKIQLLVASDVAARGLDIPDVSHVFNFDVPIHAEDYVHRIGRTGRAGREGAAFTLVSRSEMKHLEAIQKLITTEIEWLSPIPEGDAADDSETEKKRGRGDKRGKRGREREARPESDKTAPVAAEERKPREKPEKQEPRSEPKRERKDRRREDDGRVPVGFGEDIPAFMMNGQ
ncbi:DEAD/DEAH box helicase [Oricola thermophila]|uniref:DEAD-box ATP-dependent RNA helicase RhpA n=1 Tax=Oricola thermophila TaxID=2742145 RepID=A0A6N1V9Y3_9HYPH|nr:DEAD/DEAH box helicase [Oricola thermophila]QKV17811.1 DEAD/DEAH box helicase [Oricola thermophila]